VEYDHGLFFDREILQKNVRFKPSMSQISLAD